MNSNKHTAKDTHSLNLTKSEALKILQCLSDRVLVHETYCVMVDFSDKFNLGSGSMIRRAHSKTCTVIVGTNADNLFTVDNENSLPDIHFVKMTETLFHEIAHYKRSVNGFTSDISLSELSKEGNPNYYEANWAKFPHEIDAEFTGVMSTWGFLEEFYPRHADRLMLEFLHDKVNGKTYPIKEPEGGFQSKGQVSALFEEAYEKALHEKREFPIGHQRFDDEFMKMFKTQDGVMDSRYVPFDNALLTAKTGSELDRMMASLVAYIHPELESLYPGLDFRELEPEKVFGMPMPETREEIIARIDASAIESLSIGDAFTKAVNDMSEEGAGYEM